MAYSSIATADNDWIFSVIVIFFLFQAPLLASYYNSYFTTYSKEDWRGIAHSIEENSNKGDYIIVIHNNSRLPLDFYYNNTSDGTYEFGVQNESEKKSILLGLQNKQAYFIVTRYVNTADPSGNTTFWLLNNIQKIEIFREIEHNKLNFSK